MERIKIPERIKGRWKHALILTFGCDFIFFENGILHQFNQTCGNKIILADGEQYTNTVANYQQQSVLENNLIRHANRHYLIEGVFTSGAFHPKMILLCNEQQGRLLVGSGNVSHQGFVSGGELFTEYEFNLDEDEYLSEFIAAREFVDELINLGFVNRQAQKMIRVMYEQCVWLLRNRLRHSTVVHNLHRSFLSQVIDKIDGRDVDEFWCIAPFYDEKVEALSQILQHINPKKTFVVLQEKRTSVNPSLLRSVLEQYGNQYKIYFATQENSPYLHAKLYLFKLSNETLCLHGSPNTSRAAMLNTNQYGNVELANLLSGGTIEFDYLLNELKLENVTNATHLNVEFIADNTEILGTTQQFPILISAEWEDKELILNFNKSPLKIDSLLVSIDDELVNFDAFKIDNSAYKIKLSENDLEIVSSKRPIPIFIRWNDKNVSHSVFLCDTKSLMDVVSSAGNPKVLKNFGDLNLEDEKLEELLMELQDSLVLDDNSFWQLARSMGAVESSNVLDSTNDGNIDYASIDFETLQLHPSIKQYSRQFERLHLQDETRLESILKSILSSFKGFSINVNTLVETVDIDYNIIADFDISEPEDMEEKEREEEQNQALSSSMQKRIRSALISFISRYIKGISSKKFQEHAGVEIITKNYVIFVHFLWHLLANEMFDRKKVLDALLKSLEFFWGQDEESGYYNQLETEDKQISRKIIEELNADATVLALMYYCNKIALQDAETKILYRNFVQNILTNKQLPMHLNRSSFVNAAFLISKYLPNVGSLPTRILDALVSLSNFNDRQHFIKDLKVNYGISNCRFERVKVADYQTVDCLVVENHPELTIYENFLNLLCVWTRFENLPYYRIVTDEEYSKQVLIFYKTPINSITYNNSIIGEFKENIKLPVTLFPWEIILDHAKDEVDIAEAKMMGVFEINKQ